VSDHRRVVQASGEITSAQVEEAMGSQTLEDGSKPTRAHVMAGLLYQVALENLSVAEHLLEGKDFHFSCQLELLDPQEERLKRTKDRLRRDILGE